MREVRNWIEKNEAGFQKMRVNQKLSDGSSIEIHYQYNTITNKAYDIKVADNKKAVK
jgi:filamentous hemagglutinin